MEIQRIIYNWFYTTDVGEQFEEHIVGKDGVSTILECLPQVPSDVLHYLVEFEDGKRELIYNINKVEYTFK